jgi:hypothetical protein
MRSKLLVAQWFGQQQVGADPAGQRERQYLSQQISGGPTFAGGTPVR